MITQRMLLSGTKIVSFNDFKLYRSPNGKATIIEYHWPNSNGTMGSLKKLEVIDARWRGAKKLRNSTINHTSGVIYSDDNGYDGNSYI